ncbi:MAG: flagellar brake protein [Pigmentiphaga sp.]|uniref:flagellar brake protein n=1 Tax=Pigmentiphaga sp. TaxID=1977564 RepID=UPI0029B3E64F|nr:flagellar regulator YcgR PilZN domain-containing protein [Pigmentiphaga sp.]MDX3906884.1 flagellar brake protein [Pigmentiphaga sp.]
MTENPLLPLSPEPIDDALLEDFRIAQPLEIMNLLGRMAEQAEIVALGTEDGISVLSAIAEVDRAKRLLWLFGTEGDARLQRLIDSHHVVAVGYLDHVKIQFRVLNLQWLPYSQGLRPACLLPMELYRFQRRMHFRVRPMQSPPATVRLEHGRASRPMELVVIDISMTGIGLALPPGSPMIAVGTRLPRAVIALDTRTRLVADLKVMHVTPRREPRQGHHMGCTLNGLDAQGLRDLQRFISQAQLRQGNTA